MSSANYVAALDRLPPCDQPSGDPTIFSPAHLPPLQGILFLLLYSYLSNAVAFATMLHSTSTMFHCLRISLVGDVPSPVDRPHLGEGSR